MKQENEAGAGSDASTRLQAETELGLVLVTGAAGFLGKNIVLRLLSAGCRVRALIRSTPIGISHDRLEVVKGDINDTVLMRNACKGVDTVFHTAAAISLMGGIAASKRYRQHAYAVNVQGTQTVLDSCTAESVSRLIYTSSVDVCFEGKPLANMHEQMPYARVTKSVYAQTKIEAEKRVLQANGKQGLLTCAIRPDGIYGGSPNEMIDRFFEQLVAGRLVARIGSASVLQDNSQVDNLVQAHLLAAMHLVPEGAACGQAYFIGDDEPMNSFEFFRPIIEGLGYRFPSREIPAALLRPVLIFWEALHFLLSLPAPMLSPHELDKVSVTHYASIDKARRELSYHPLKRRDEAMRECIEYCRSRL